jgi:hypothetical protein
MVFLNILVIENHKWLFIKHILDITDDKFTLFIKEGLFVFKTYVFTILFI